MRAGRVLATLILCACAGACSLAIDATDIDEGCDPEEEKRCDDQCVLISDPAYGCQVDVCTPCAFAHAIPHCVQNECTPRTCLEGYCGADCETNMLVDEMNCGECGHACLENQSCREGACVPK